MKSQDKQTKALKNEWQTRNAQRKSAFEKTKVQNPIRETGAEARAREIMNNLPIRSEFDKAKQTPAREQDNKRNRDDDRER